MKPWYEKLFENYAENYDQELFTRGTAQEVTFIEKEIDFNKEAEILDVGCGTGRHAIELAKRGYKVTGIDLSESQLARAKMKADEYKVSVDFIKADARELNFFNEFDLVIMLCEGGFPLMETDEMNFKILENTDRALKQNGKLIFTTLSALYPLTHSVKDLMDANMSGDVVSNDTTFDLMTFRDLSSFTFKDDSGMVHTIQCNERYYTPSEITWLLKALGLKDIHIYGCKTGEFSRDLPLAKDHFEMLVITQKGSF